MELTEGNLKRHNQAIADIYMFNSSSKIMSNNPLLQNEEEKYETIEIGRKYSSQHNNHGEKSQHVDTKTMRSAAEIDDYLRHYIPPFTDSTMLLKSLFFIVLLGFNISYIIERFIQKINGNEIDREQRYLEISDEIVVYFEFGGLILLFLFYFCPAIFKRCCGKESTADIINSIIYIKTWSVFKLFYKFRPDSVIDNLVNCYKHIYEETNNAFSNEIEIKKWKFMLEELKKEINNPKIMNLNKEKLKEVFNEVEHVMNQEQLKKNQTQNAESTNFMSRYIASRETNFKNTSWRKMIDGVSWIILIIILIGFLFIGFLSLILKLEQFAFITQKDAFSFTLYELWLLISFCNQLWSMINEDEIRTDTIYKCLFMDCIKCSYSTNVAKKVKQIDDTIKANLWKYHSIFLPFKINWKFVFKLSFKQSFDVISNNKLGKQYEYITKKLKNIEFQKYSNSEFVGSTISIVSVILNLFPFGIQDDTSQEVIPKKESCITKMRHFTYSRWTKLKNKMNFRSKWKPLHPYTQCQYLLFTINKSKQSYTDGMWFVSTFQIFKYSRYLLPLFWIISGILGLLIFGIRNEEIKRLEKCGDESLGEDIYSMFAWDCCCTAVVFVAVLSFSMLYICIKQKQDESLFVACSGLLVGISLVAFFVRHIFDCLIFGYSFSCIQQGVSGFLYSFFISIYLYITLASAYLAVFVLVWLDFVLMVLVLYAIIIIVLFSYLGTGISFIFLTIIEMESIAHFHSSTSLVSQICFVLMPFSLALVCITGIGYLLVGNKKSIEELVHLFNIGENPTPKRTVWHQRTCNGINLSFSFFFIIHAMFVVLEAFNIFETNNNIWNSNIWNFNIWNWSIVYLLGNSILLLCRSLIANAAGKPAEYYWPQLNGFIVALVVIMVSIMVIISLICVLLYGLYWGLKKCFSFCVFE
eukprot:319654_1